MRRRGFDPFDKRAMALSPTLGDASATAEVFRRVIVEPAYKAVSAEIERAILGGALPLGAALPTELGLSTLVFLEDSDVVSRRAREISVVLHPLRLSIRVPAS